MNSTATQSPGNDTAYHDAADLQGTFDVNFQNPKNFPNTQDAQDAQDSHLQRLGKALSMHPPVRSIIRTVRTVSGIRQYNLSSSTGPSNQPLHPYLVCADPIAFAHRAGGRQAPENTCAAIDCSSALGFQYMEIDVHLSKDGIPVVCHDPKLDRTTDRSGAISSLTCAEIQQADAGYRFTTDGGKTFPYRGKGVVVPSLAEVLANYPNLRFNIDPKSDQVVAPMMAVIAKHNAFNRVGISCSSDRRIEAARRIAPKDVCTAMGPTALVTAVVKSRKGTVPSLGAHYIQAPYVKKVMGSVDAKFIRAAHASHMRVHLWTINDPVTMHYLFDIGCDGITTDDPATLKKVMESRGIWHPPTKQSTPSKTKWWNSLPWQVTQLRPRPRML